MSDEPNPFVNRAPWTVIRFGGVIMRAALIAIDDVSTEDQWQEQASKETSGKVQVFQGTKKGKFKAKYLCWNEDSYKAVQEHWEMLKPVPTLGGGSGTSAPKAPTGGSQYMAAAQVKPGQVGGVPAPSKFDAIDTAASDTKDKSGGKSNPGPKPPTISVEYPSLQRHGITAVARGKWTDVGFTETNGYVVDIEYVAQDPPKPAGTGALAPAQAAAGAQLAQKKPDGSTPSPAAAQAGGV
jgi:hypothetical protein